MLQYPYWELRDVTKVPYTQGMLISDKQGLPLKYTTEPRSSTDRLLNNQKGHIDLQIKTVKLKPLN